MSGNNVTFGLIATYPPHQKWIFCYTNISTKIQVLFRRKKVTQILLKEAWLVIIVILKKSVPDDNLLVWDTFFDASQCLKIPQKVSLEYLNFRAKNVQSCTFRF